MIVQQLGRIIGSETSDEYVQMNQPYAELNAIRFANGETDYLAMGTSPAIIAPAPPFLKMRYVNMTSPVAAETDAAHYEMTAIA